MSELKTSENQRRQSARFPLGLEKMFWTLFDSSKDAIFIHDLTGRLLEVNQAACEFLKQSQEELLRLATSDIDMFRFAGLLPERFKELKQSRYMITKTTHRPQDGTIVPIELKSQIIEYYGNPAVLSIARDITDRNKTEEMLRQSEELYRAVVTQTADPIYLIDLESRYLLESNSAFQRLLGYTPGELKKLTVYDLVAHEKENVDFHIEQVISQKQHFHGERRLRRKDGTLLDVEVTANLITYAGRKVICAVARNISERKKAEEALRESEKKYSTLVENSLTGIYIDQEGKIVFANNKFAEIYGYARDELIGMETWELVYTEARAFTKEIRTKRLKSEEAPLEHEARGVRKDGKIIWVTRRNTRIEYKGKPAILGNVAEITQRKMMEMALQESEKKLRLLFSHLLTAQEKERKRISIELHDELGQALLALKLQLRAIEKNLGEERVALKQECESTLKYIDQTIDNVRRLSRDLSPSILEDLGLSAAIRWLIGGFVKHYDIEISMDMAEIDNLFSKEEQIIIYRVFQEALTNVVKHSDATHASVVVGRQDCKVSFFIEDDGKGFNFEQALTRDATERGLGLTTMDERIRMLGGSLDIWSQEGKGTRITFILPIEEGTN
ncbi:MAG: PAS domain S-box protein [Thermodesulfobacteriota bacterium]|nr:PAS domain S-box protein [Thermodesulfobacteriota bacterium]